MMLDRTRLLLLLMAGLLNCMAGCGGDAAPSSSMHNEIGFEAAFDSGSLEADRYLDKGRFVVQPRPDYGRDGAEGSDREEASWNGKTWWYHFSVTVPDEHLPFPIELVIDQSLVWNTRMYAADKVPVVSCDGVNWRFVNSWATGIENPVIYETLTCPTTYVAMATPYPWTRMETFLQSLATSPYIIQQDTIGHTPMGENQASLPLYYLLLGGPGDPSGRRNIVVVSGQHSGETTNSWMLTGLIEFLLSDDAVAKSLRQHFVFHIYPAVNPEGVKFGHYRRTAESPLNTNRAWDTSEVREVEIVRSHILSQTRGLADYFFDLHGSSRTKHFIYHCADKPKAHEWVQAVATRHPHVAAEYGQRPSSFVDRARGWALSALRSHADPLEPPLSFTPEGSYAQGSWQEAPDQTTDWKALGAVLVQAIYDIEEKIN